MKKAFVILAISVSSSCLLGASKDLGVGTIEIPPGFTEERTGTIDSRRGTITNLTTNLQIGYDIGHMAGTHMHPKKEGLVWYREQTLGNQKAYIGLIQDGQSKRVAITLLHKQGLHSGTPWNYPANFWADIEDEQQLTDLLLIALSYRPKEKDSAALQESLIDTDTVGDRSVQEENVGTCEPATIIQSLSRAIGKLAGKYPELAEYQAGKALVGPTSLYYAFRFQGPAFKIKRGILPSDFGEHGCRIQFGVAPKPPPADRVSASRGPDLVLDNLGLEVWFGVATCEHPSEGFVREVGEVLRSHIYMLEQLDKEIINEPESNKKKAHP
ncbi:MAG: hypothetical protein RRC34_04245 [Lentisphaeria bacterium]|nr:hypothetical protein [Lentisphaeria bacterium]